MALVEILARASGASALAVHVVDDVPKNPDHVRRRHVRRIAESAYRIAGDENHAHVWKLGRNGAKRGLHALVLSALLLSLFVQLNTWKSVSTCIGITRRSASSMLNAA